MATLDTGMLHDETLALIGTVRERYATAIELYRRRNFERIAIRRRYYQPEDVDAVVMRLRPLTP